MAIQILRPKVVPIPTGNQKPLSPECSTAERLDYMADMIMQLKGLASAGNLHVLSGILEVAYQEARAQARRS